MHAPNACCHILSLCWNSLVDPTQTYTYSSSSIKGRKCQPENSNLVLLVFPLHSQRDHLQNQLLAQLVCPLPSLRSPRVPVDAVTFWIVLPSPVSYVVSKVCFKLLINYSSYIYWCQVAFQPWPLHSLPSLLLSQYTIISGAALSRSLELTQVYQEWGCWESIKAARCCRWQRCPGEWLHCSQFTFRVAIFLYMSILQNHANPQVDPQLVALWVVACWPMVEPISHAWVWVYLWVWVWRWLPIPRGIHTCCKDDRWYGSIRLTL